MQALNAATLTPLSVISNRRNEPKKFPSFPFKNFPNSTNLSTTLSRNVHGGLMLLSNVFTTGLAKALTYEEALQQSTTSSSASDFDANAFVETLNNFVSDNPLVIAGVAAILALPLVFSQVFGSNKPKSWGVESAKKAYAKLADDVSSELVDLRATVELKQVGSPDIRGLKKKPVTIVYKGEDKPGFLNKLALRFKEPENTTLFILDKFDGNSELVAELVTANSFKAAYAIKDGAEGPRGWKNSGLPWILPKKTFSLDLGVSDALDDLLGDASDAVAVGLGVAAASAFGLLVFSEAETLLQLLGSAALVQLVSTKLLFAEDRKQSLQQVDEFLTKEVSPKELIGDIKYADLKPPTSLIPSQPSGSVKKDETVAKVELSSESTPEVNSVPKPEVTAAALTGITRPLSPYPNYPDLKPPSSPMPTQA
ncbi:rhodanese-like domain-containing protein 4, chloroplastic isoform X4 [Capsicum annuum]|uniref:rhodanese-like domain-containing protein 4, chloroplastic isoform X4 n=1 Tax=Capsicum annuum TaxID=4072 RepID=UPI001FB12C8E|nr:rhodanese-like domain-containing protein 4, chloroplastic isoform X4 [Capsicum annuum]